MKTWLDSLLGDLFEVERIDSGQSDQNVVVESGPPRKNRATTNEEKVELVQGILLEAASQVYDKGGPVAAASMAVTRLQEFLIGEAMNANATK